MHGLLNRAAVWPGGRWLLRGGGRQQAVSAIAEHIQHALASCIECLQPRVQGSVKTPTQCHRRSLTSADIQKRTLPFHLYA